MVAWSTSSFFCDDGRKAQLESALVKHVSKPNNRIILSSGVHRLFRFEMEWHCTYFVVSEEHNLRRIDDIINSDPFFDFEEVVWRLDV